MKTRIMYVEFKGDDIEGPAWIGRVKFSKTGRTLYYRDKTFKPLKPRGYKANYEDSETGERYWISGCKKDGSDRLYSGVVEIDEDVATEYWTAIRNLPEQKNQRSIRDDGKYSR